MVDFNLSPVSPYISNDIDLVLHQIDILFDTNPREVLGHPDFGSQYGTYLYDLRASNEAIKQQVISDLSGIDMRGYQYNVTVHLLQGTEKDIALIEIDIWRDEEKYNQIYKITQ